MALSGVRAIVYNRDDGLCVRCGVYLSEYDMATARGSIHHRKLRSQGGPNTAANLITLCGSGTTGCHGWVHGHPAEARNLGLIVHRIDDPASVPVLGWSGWLRLGTSEQCQDEIDTEAV